MGKSKFWNQFRAANLIENLPFIFFIGMIGLIYIANSHYAEKQSRKIRKVEAEVQSLKRQHMQVLSTLMHEKKHTRIESEVKQLGLLPPQSRPYRIVVK